MYILLVRSPCSLTRNLLYFKSNTQKVKTKNLFFRFWKKYLTFDYDGVNLGVCYLKNRYLGNQIYTRGRRIL